MLVADDVYGDEKEKEKKRGKNEKNVDRTMTVVCSRCWSLLSLGR